jgi:hypothetical protein
LENWDTAWYDEEEKNLKADFKIIRSFAYRPLATNFFDTLAPSLLSSLKWFHLIWDDSFIVKTFSF